jgi:hypothetical protein
MTIEPLAVWSLLPDWADGITETLEFLTTVAESPLGVEQRRGLRITPRQYFELSYVLGGPDRTHFDLLTIRAAGSAVYLPLWHDVEILHRPYLAGETVLEVDTRYTEIRFVKFVFIGGNNDFEVGEIAGWTDESITLVNGLVNDWPKQTRVCPIKKCRVEPQPSTTRRSDGVHVARIKFCSMERNRSDAEPGMRTLLDQYVLEEDPNEVDDLSYAYERTMSVLDNKTGKQHLHDVAGRVLQQFAWWKKGRQQHRQLRGLFYALDGRRLPVWVPTVYQDFELVLPIVAVDPSIYVKRCGFTELGGPSVNREVIMVQARSGLRFYQTIIDSIVRGDGISERLILEGPLGVDLAIDEVLRISFLVSSRLDQDAIEFTHHTATRGMTTTVAVFRSALAGPGALESGVVEGDPPPPMCLHDFNWFAASPTIPAGLSAGAFPTRIDKYGNQYIPSVFNDFVEVYNINGAKVNTLTPPQIKDAVNAWAERNIFSTPPSESYYNIYACPVLQGEYVFVYTKTAHSGGTFDHWWVLMEPAANGSLTVKGAYYNGNLLGPPYTNGLNVYEVTESSAPITFQCYFAIGSNAATIAVLPSIQDFIAGTYSLGFGTLPDYQVPNTLLYPIGNKTDLSNYLYRGGRHNESNAFGFRLPGNERELLFVYMNRSYLDFCATTTTVAFPPEVRNIIQPANPLGAMLKIPLGDLDYFGLASTVINTTYRGRATADYEIDNGTWGVPFTEEYTYLSDGNAGGEDTFSTQVSTRLRANGNHWVVFLMTGWDDSLYRGEVTSEFGWESPVYVKMKLYDYNPPTEHATLAAEHICILHTDTDIPRGGHVLSDDLHLIAEVFETPGLVTVVIRGPVFRTTFFRFGLSE